MSACRALALPLAVLTPRLIRLGLHVPGMSTKGLMRGESLSCIQTQFCHLHSTFPDTQFQSNKARRSETEPTASYLCTFRPTVYNTKTNKGFLIIFSLGNLKRAILYHLGKYHPILVALCLFIPLVSVLMLSVEWGVLTNVQTKALVVQLGQFQSLKQEKSIKLLGFFSKSASPGVIFPSGVLGVFAGSCDHFFFQKQTPKDAFLPKGETAGSWLTQLPQVDIQGLPEGQESVPVHPVCPGPWVTL